MRRIPAPVLSQLSLHFFSPCLVIFVAGGVLREPAAKHAFLLQEHFADAPKAGEGKAGWQMPMLKNTAAPTMIPL